MAPCILPKRSRPLRVAQHSTDLGGEASRLRATLLSRTDDRTKRFPRAKTEDLLAWLTENQYLDDRSPLAALAVGHRALAAVNEDLAGERLSTGQTHLLVRTLLTALGCAEPTPGNPSGDG